MSLITILLLLLIFIIPILPIIFSQFLDEKQEYDLLSSNIQIKMNDLQTINLSINQLKNEIKNKENLITELKAKEGEELDYSNRIKGTCLALV